MGQPRHDEEPSPGSAPRPAVGPQFAVFDEMREGVQILDRDWRYVYVNQAAAAHGQSSVDALLGRRLQEMYPGFDKTPAFAVLARCMTLRVPDALENEFEYPTGGRRWFDLRVEPVSLGLLILSIDITHQKRLEDELRTSRENLSAVLTCMGDGIIATDTAGLVTHMNPAAERLTGCPRSVGVGDDLRNLVRFLDQRTLEPVTPPVERIMRDGMSIELSNGTVLEARDGRRTPIASSGVPLRDRGGALRGAVVLLRDMAEEHRLTQMLQQAQKMEAVGLLAGGVAHDFNNLLTVILGYAEILLTALPEGSPHRPQLDQIWRAGRSAGELTQQLLAFSRKRIVRPRVIDLNAILARTERMVQRLIGEDIELEMRLGADVPTVHFDAGQVEQILMNLVVNARDAMPAGGRLLVETAGVDLDATYVAEHPGAAEGPHAVFSVTDTGEGMSRETLARVFEPFFTTKELGRGTGLGLSTVYGMVKQGRGNIWVYSELGRGTAFKVYLPACPGAVVAPEEEASPAALAGTGTILLVEDSDGVRDFSRAVLEAGGYRVLAARTPAEALAMEARWPHAIDLLLTDVVLPEMNGRQLAEALRERRPDLRVAFVSGYPRAVIARQGVIEDGVQFLEKPFTPTGLLRSVRTFLA